MQFYRTWAKLLSIEILQFRHVLIEVKCFVMELSCSFPYIPTKEDFLANCGLSREAFWGGHSEFLRSVNFSRRLAGHFVYTVIA